jgi:large subunit ribosomal protein L1
MGMKFINALEEAKKSKQRRFKQSVDLIINLEGIDFNKPENRVVRDVVLPNGLGRDLKPLVIADSCLAQAKKIGVAVIGKNELPEDKKEMKKIARADIILAEAPLMPLIGKKLGSILGPRGKMPLPFPPKADLSQIISRARKMVRIRAVKPTIHVKIGTEEMDNKELAENANTVIDTIRDAMPKARIKSVFIKLTMGQAIKVGE